MRISLKLLALISVPLYSTAMHNTVQQTINFDRERISEAEGYWAASDAPERDHYKGKYPFPVSNQQPWPGQEEFLKKLSYIESLATDYNWDNSEKNSKIVRLCAKGCSFSRFDPATSLGNGEFMDAVTKIRWTQDLRRYYIAKFNVKPSKEFYEYVMNFPTN